MADSFYVPDGDAFVSTELTRGPWDPNSQHAGPPAALIARAIELFPSDEGPRAVGRVTYEILRPVPIERLAVSTRLVRPGRRVELIEATLSDENERELVRATAWRVRTREAAIADQLTGAGGEGAAGAFASTLRPGFTPPGPQEGKTSPFFETGESVGYYTAMDYRFVAGEWIEPGPATAWLRMRRPLVAGEEPTPLQRVLVAADSGNGISATIDFTRFLFINVDLTVHLHRMPESEWICLDSITIPERNGVGITDTALHDERGPIGRAAQTLLIAER